MTKKRDGFTLLEMSIVLFIISLLILIIIPNLAKQRHSATGIHQRAMMNVIQTQADLFENETGYAASNLKQLYNKDYLTESQLKDAEHNHIRINNGQVQKK